MMKHLKKLTLTITAAFLFCLTASAATENLLPLPSITTDETEEDKQETPIQPLADDDETEPKNK